MLSRGARDWSQERTQHRNVHDLAGQVTRSEQLERGTPFEGAV